MKIIIAGVIAALAVTATILFLNNREKPLPVVESKREVELTRLEDNSLL